jgi:hypothetical protein
VTGREGRAWSPQPFLAHLNQRHPDTVLFLGRYLTDDWDLVAADLVDVHADRLTLSVTTTGSERSVTVTLPDPVTSRAEFLTAIRRFLTDARAARPGEPLTSLEADIAKRSGGSHDHQAPRH